MDFFSIFPWKMCIILKAKLTVLVRKGYDAAYRKVLLC